MDPDAENLNAIAQWAIRLMDALGGPGAGLAIALENLFPPLPSEIILPLAGFAASRGQLGLIEVILRTPAGSIIGALSLYGLGRWLGRERFRALAVRIPFVKLSDVDKVEAWFAKHGTKAVFFGRMLPIFRSLISIPAGIEQMPILRFTALTAAGSLIWNSVFIYAGFHLGENWALVEQYAGILSKTVLIGGLLSALGFVALRIRSANRERAARDLEPTG